MVRRRFGADTNAAKATTGQWLRIGLASFLTLSCWARWAAGDVVATALLPFSAWLLVAHTAHDATHGSLSARPWVNYWFQFTAHPLFFNVFVWIPQHLISRARRVEGRVAVAATPRRRRGDSLMNRGRAAAATWTFRGDDRRAPRTGTTSSRTSTTSTWTSTTSRPRD